MSDYLWDKSGEPDPTIERLEELLAAKRFEGEPLRLPTAIPVQTKHAARPRYAYPQFAALAACIVLAVVVGVWMQIRHESGEAERVLVAAGDVRREAPVEESGQPSTSRPIAPVVEVEELSGTVTAGLAEKRVRRRTREPFRAAAGTTRVAEIPGDEPFSVVGIARGARSKQIDDRKSRVAADDAGATEAVARLHDERVRAKEQLMLAMRMTSAKLNVARDKTQAAHAADGELR